MSDENNYNKEHNTSFLSDLFFCWVFSLIKKRKEEINLDSIPYCNDSDKTFINMNKFEKELYNNDNTAYARELPKNYVLKKLIKHLSVIILIILVFSCVTAALDFMSTVLFRNFIKQFSKDKNISKEKHGNEESESGDYRLDSKILIIMGSLFFLFKFLSLLFLRYITYLQNKIGARCMAFISSLIYKKLLYCRMYMFNILELASISSNDSNNSDKRIDSNTILKESTIFKEGQIINLIQVDSKVISDLITQGQNIIVMPIQVLLYAIYLFIILGWSFISGFIFMTLCFIVNYSIFKQYRLSNKELLTNKDKRMNLTTEILNSIKPIKLNAWEHIFLNRIEDSRAEEVGSLRKIFMISCFSNTFNYLMPIASAIVAIGTYNLFNDVINIENAFTCILIFNILQQQIRLINLLINLSIEVGISCTRIQKFLEIGGFNNKNIAQNNISIKNSDVDNSNDDDSLLDYAIEVKTSNYSWFDISSNNINYIDNSHKILEKDCLKRNISDIKYSNIEFIRKSKSNDSDDLKIKLIDTVATMNKDDSDNVINKVIPLKEGNIINEEEYKSLILDKILLKNISFSIKKGELVCIIGKVGSGKSSLLYSILKELNSSNSYNNSENICNRNQALKVNGSIAITTQIPWIENKTIKDNILYQSFDSSNKEANTVSDENNQTNFQYDQIIKLCQLSKDLEMLSNQDNTEIGEKGINLSGGQKSRIALARAIYSNRDIFLLDDPFSSLDADVSYSIFNEVILSYLKAKTRIIVTHNLGFLKYSDRVMVMSQGEIVFNSTYDCFIEKIKQGYFEEYKEKDFNSDNKEDDDKINLNIDNNDNDVEEEFSYKKLLFENKTTNIINSIDNTENKSIKESKDTQASLTLQEEKETGNLDIIVYYNYIIMSGGIANFALIILGCILAQLSKFSSDIFLKEWEDNKSNWNQTKSFFIYSVIALSAVVFVYFRLYTTFTGSIKLSKQLHSNILFNLMKASITSFHDRIPRGRINNRLSKDLDTVDRTVYQYGFLLHSMINLIFCISVSSYYFIYYLLYLPVLLVLGIIITNYYRKCSRELTRLEGISRSPITNQLSETIYGSCVIRAFNKQEEYLMGFCKKNDKNFIVKLFGNACANWFSLYIGLLSLFFLLFQIIIIIVFKNSFNKGEIALMLNYGILLQGSVFDMLNVHTLFELSLISLERCLDYCKIKSEEGYIEDVNYKNGIPDSNKANMCSGKEGNLDSLNIVYKENMCEMLNANISKITEIKLIQENDNEDNNKTCDDRINDDKIDFSKDIDIQNLSANYRENTEIILNNINLRIKQGEKIGLIGRTGCGKSSLCLSLLKVLNITEGTILIGNKDIKDIDNYYLRKNISIIPQDPVLFKGSIKYNLDPLDQYSNERIIELLKEVDLEYLLTKTTSNNSIQLNNNTKINDDKEINTDNKHRDHLVYEDKYNLDYLIEEGGKNISVGERQLLCISRAILRNSSIMILDEATANIDYNTERKIQFILEKYFRHKTIIIIAHRIKTILGCNR